MRYSLHIIQFTYLKFIDFYRTHRVLQPHHNLILENFHNSKKKLMTNSSHSTFLSLFLQPLKTTNLLSIFIDLPIPDGSCKRNHTVCGLLWVISFTRLMFSRFIQIVCIRLYYHLWLNSIPLSGYITFQSLSIQQLVDIWVISIFWLFEIMLLCTCFCENVFISLEYVPRNRITVVCLTVLTILNSMFNLSRDRQTVF